MLPSLLGGPEGLKTANMRNPRKEETTHGKVRKLGLISKRAKLLLLIAVLGVMALLTACGEVEKSEVVVTGTPEPATEMTPSVIPKPTPTADAGTELEATAVPASVSTSVPQLELTAEPTTSKATPDVDHEAQAERNRAVIKRYVEEEQDAATLTNVMITCAASAGITLTDRIKTGGRAEDQLAELILAGVLDNYDVLECTADEIVEKVEDGN